MKRSTVLPFALPDLGEAELIEIKEVLDSGWITTGAKAHRFEQDFAATVGAKFGVAVNSCTAAMHLALEALEVQRGDYVITTPYTFAATAEVIRYLDATPVLVDVEPDTLNIDPRALDETIEDLNRCLEGRSAPATVGVARALAQDSPSSRPSKAPVLRPRAAVRKRHRAAIKALMPVHIAGHPCDMDAISEIAAKHALPVVEDAAHAFPSSFGGRPVGSPLPGGVHSMACFSFYATKTITTGEGGMVVTDREDWADRCRVMSLHGISRDAWKRYTAEGSWYYEIGAPGFKYNMPDLAAALGLAQLRKVEAMRRRREEIARRYTEAFSNDPALEVPTLRPSMGHAWHLYMIRLNAEHLSIDRNDVVVELKKAGIGASVHFIPLHIHPYYTGMYGYEPHDFPVAYREYQREISLPIYSKMTDVDVQDVIDGVTDVVSRSRAKVSYALAGR
jgi:dTDP-4-amino-4,6-dideoxygalactose transaminase